MSENEFIAGTPIQVGLTFIDEITGVLTNPSTVTGYIWLGVNAPLVTFHLSDLVTTPEAGVLYYVFATAGIAPGYYTVQVQSEGTVAGISNPAVFTILAPSTAGLT